MNNERKKYLLKNIFVFALSNFSTKLIIFLLVPLYTSTMTPSQYGIVDLLFTVCGFLYPLFTLNISEGIYRFSLDKDSNENKIFSISIICFIISLILSLITIPILKTIPNYNIYALLFYIYLIFYSLSQILLVTLKGQEKLKLFTIGNLINVVCIAIFSIIFMKILKMEIKGYFYANILSNLVTVIYGFFSNKIATKFRNFDFDISLFKKIVKYTIILIPTSFMWWIINSSDRIMVASLVGEYANGIYAISYKIPSMVIVVAQIFNQAWTFSAIKEKDSIDNEIWTNRIFNIFWGVLVLIGIIIVIIIKPLFHFYVSSNFYAAWKYVPLLVIGFVFMTASTFISTSYNVHKDSKGFLVSGVVGAITNIILNFILIPKIHVYGAAIATALSYIIIFFYRLIDTRKYIKILINKKIIFLLLFLLLSCAFSYIKYGFIFQFLLLNVSLCMYKNEFIDIIKLLFLKKV